FFFQAEDGIRDFHVTGVQTCALPISYRQNYLSRKIGTCKFVGSKLNTYMVYRKGPAVLIISPSFLKRKKIVYCKITGNAKVIDDHVHGGDCHPFVCLDTFCCPEFFWHSYLQ